MTPLRRFVVLSGFVVACASRAGYVEPGPLSANANPPSPPGLASSPPLQGSRTFGSNGENPPRLNLAGAEVRDPPPQPATNQAPVECRGDDDCVPAACCHPTTCVPVAQAPACAGVMCTRQCAPGTLDCGQAHCTCAAGRCGVTGGPSA